MKYYFVNIILICVEDIYRILKFKDKNFIQIFNFLKIKCDKIK